MVIQSHTPAPFKDPVAEISAYLAAELQVVQRLLHEIITSESPLVREVGEYISFSSGKKLRPMMTMLTSRAFGPSGGELPVNIATAMEAIHVATLIHDDVIDKAALRRNIPSVNARWGDDVAILMADYLFSCAFDLALYQLAPDPLRMLTNVTRKMCEGEMFQIEHRGQWLTREDYLTIIRNKTACLFSACCALGALCSGLPADAVAKASDFGMYFGMAFQITDDTLDYVASDQHWGKSVGIDLAAGKQTLPLILALADATPEDRRQLEAILGNGRDLKAIEPIFARYRTLERSRELARDYAAQARAALSGLPIADETAYELLMALPDYVVNRSF